jgi:hypothetical protein
MFFTTPDLVFAYNVIIVVFASGVICDVAYVLNVALVRNVANASNCV